MEKKCENCKHNGFCTPCIMTTYNCDMYEERIGEPKTPMKINSKDDCEYFGLRTPQKPCGTCNKDCIYSAKPKPQTNRQWLESLSDEELTKILTNCHQCYFCIIDDIANCDSNCEENIQKWLQAEHKE